MICTALLCLLAERGREERTQKTHKTWFPLVGTCQKTCGSKCQKHNTLKNLKKLFFQNWPLIYIYIYVYIRTWAQGGSEERTKIIRRRWNPSRQGTLPVMVPPLEWPPTYMIGPRWKRRSFVDDGIPPDRVPFRSRFHRWNGLRHDRATMETKIIRGRWNPSRHGSGSRLPALSCRAPCSKLATLTVQHVSCIWA